MRSISEKAKEIVFGIETTLHEPFSRFDAIELVNQERVLRAFQNNGVAARHFAPSTGYGYDDIGRDTLDRVFAEALQAEDALVRSQIINGTHAIFLALSGVTEPGDTIFSVTGAPYDTLQQAVGIYGDMPHSLKKSGITFQSIPLSDDGTIDLDTAYEQVKVIRPKVIYMQRSRGYAWRRALDPRTDLKPVMEKLRSVSPDSIFVVDNCYGEFTTTVEPTALGADVIAGSLIKNPGGGLAPNGGYVAGRHELIERIAQKLTVPGIGREAGSFAGDYRAYYQGLFMAPHCVDQCLKAVALFSALFEKLGYDRMPDALDMRADITQSVRFRTGEELIAFCQTIQSVSPVDSFVVPEPWDMPGYNDPVIMAAGSFVQGSTTELSADGPVKAPYTAYMQGSLTYSHARIAAMAVYDSLTGQNAE